MPDVMTPQQRHDCMSHIRSKNTKPEQLVRRALWHLGFRYRLHVKDLSGKPDIVLPKYKAYIPASIHNEAMLSGAWTSIAQ